MNYFKGYGKKKGKRSSLGATKFVGQYTKGALALSLGSSILSQPAFGAIGQQGAQGLMIGAQFLPPIAVIGASGVVLKQVKKLKRYSK